jgi:hypothetical protein
MRRCWKIILINLPADRCNKFNDEKIYMPYDRRTKRKTKPLMPTMLRPPKMSANISRIVWKTERASILLKLYMASRKKTTPANNGMIEKVKALSLEISKYFKGSTSNRKKM